MSKFEGYRQLHDGCSMALELNFCEMHEDRGSDGGLLLYSGKRDAKDGQ